MVEKELSQVPRSVVLAAPWSVLQPIIILAVTALTKIAMANVTARRAVATSQLTIGERHTGRLTGLYRFEGCRC